MDAPVVRDLPQSSLSLSLEHPSTQLLAFDFFAFPLLITSLASFPPDQLRSLSHRDDASLAVVRAAACARLPFHFGIQTDN